MGGVVEQQHEDRATHAAAAAGATFKRWRFDRRLLRIPRVDASGQEGEVEVAGNVDQLHVVGGLDRDHLLAFVGGVVVLVDLVVLVRVGGVGAECHILVDLCTVFDQ